jgi:hypothetical protein
MSISSRYPVPRTTGIADIGTSAGAGTWLLVLPVLNNEKTINLEFLVPVLSKYHNR